MVTQIRVSRQGLTSCPACSRHIKVDAADWKNTVCPFCDASLEESVRRFCDGKTCAAEKRSSVLDLLRDMVGVKGGAVAASLLSLSIVTTGCEEQTAVPLYGIPPPADTGVNTIADAEPSSDSGTNEDAEARPDADTPVPLYGIPPPVDAATSDDAATVVDASSDADAGTASDSGDDKDAIVDSGDPTPVPLYGISPQDAG